MSLVRLIARPLLSVAYITNGVDRVKNPDAAAKTLEPLLRQVKKKIDLPVSATTVARASGAAQAAAGALLAIGRLPRVSSTVLVGTFLLDTFSEQFWREKDAQKRKDAKNRAIYKVSILGGALLAAVDTNGKPGVAWRAQHAAESAMRSVERNTRLAKRELTRAGKDANRVAGKAKSAVGL